MKKMMLVMAATALVAGTATVLAQSETVTSVNVVGYYSVTIPADGIALVTPVLEAFQSGTIADLLGNQLPDGSLAYIWDRLANGGAGGYVSANKSSRSGWTGPGATNIILRGDAVWLKPLDGSGSHTVTFVGEVPAEYNQAKTTTVYNISGVDAVGYSYPVDVLWTNTSLANSLPDGSILYVWDLEGQSGYTPYNKSSRSGWNTAASLVIKAGEAFWVKSSTPLDWEEVAPYDL